MFFLFLKDFNVIIKLLRLNKGKEKGILFLFSFLEIYVGILFRVGN